MANLLSDNAKLAKYTKIREGLNAVRKEVMKADAENKVVYVSKFVKDYGLTSTFCQHLVKLEAIQDVTPEGLSRVEGKRLKWIYKGNLDSIVDQALIERLIREGSSMKKTTGITRN